MKRIKSLLCLVCPAALLALAGCHGTTTTTVAGTITGLVYGTQVVLVNNGTDKINILTNGTFVFDNLVNAGSNYNVTVGTQPLGQTCTPTNNTGTIDSSGDAITNVQVSCATNTASPGTGVIFGIISGMPANTSVTLMNTTNNTTLQLTTNGVFQFTSTPLLVGAAYSITVPTATNTTGLNCVVTNGAGTIPAQSGTQSGLIPAVIVNC